MSRTPRSSDRRDSGFTARRRARRAFTVAGIERMESLSLTEPIAMLGAGAGMLAGLALVAPRPAEARPLPLRERGPVQPPHGGSAPFHTGVTGVRLFEAGRVERGFRLTGFGAGTFDTLAIAAVPPPAHAAGQWLSFLDAVPAGGSAPVTLTPTATVAPATGGGGAAVPPRGGAGSAPANSAPGTITPLRLPPPQNSNPGLTLVAPSGSNPPVAMASAQATPTTSGAQRPTLVSAAPAASGDTTSTATTGPQPQTTAAAAPTMQAFSSSTLAATSGGTSSSGGTSGGTGSGSGSFAPLTGSGGSGGAPFQVSVLDNDNGVVLFPGFDQYATLGGPADLTAQVVGPANDTYTYSWNTTNFPASNIAGASTDHLTYNWNTTSVQAITATLTLSVTDSLNNATVSQVYDFAYPQGSGPSGGSGPTWPTALAPDQVMPNAPVFPSHDADVETNTGALDTTIVLPTYNSNVPAVTLDYNSLAASPQPIVDLRHTLSTSQSTAPSQTNATLTFNGTLGTTYTYATSTLAPGDVQEIGLQANAASLATGRYAFSATVVDSYSGGPVTTTYSGSADVVNDSSSPFGAGWTVGGLEQIVAVGTSGVILDLGGGQSLWFASGGSGSFTTPAGDPDFSTLVQNSGGTYTRTLKDGTQVNFSSAGLETSLVDRNGNQTAFGYNGSNQLATITDPYGKITTFTYSSNVLSTIADPAGRTATFTISGGELTQVTLPDSSSWSYGYTGSLLTGITDPNAHTVTVAYDSADRVATITRPDSTTEEFASFQEQGWTNSGTPSSPAAAVLLAAAAATYTDPRGNTTAVRPDWYGLGQTGQTTDALGNVTTADLNANGLATVTIDRLNRVTLDVYDGKGNLTQETLPDGNKRSYGAYNAFAEPASSTNESGFTTSYTYDTRGNLTVIQDPAPLNYLTTMTYTSTGQVASVENANQHTTTFLYDSQDRLTTVTLPDAGSGVGTELYAYNAAGQVISFTNADGFATTYSFDPMNRKTGQTDPLGAVTAWGYDSGGNLTSTTDPNQHTTHYYYDSMNRVVTVTDAMNQSTVNTYDSGGNLVKVTNPLGDVSSYTYDALSRKVTATDPNNNTVTTVYDAAGEVVSVTTPGYGSQIRTTQYTYNARGWVATVTDPNGNINTLTYTPTGQTAGVAVPAPEGANGSVLLVSYSYDALDRNIGEQDALGHISTTVYDAVGNVVNTIDANNDTTTQVYDARNELTRAIDANGNAVTYSYDQAGNQLTQTDALGDQTAWSYDKDNRVLTETDPRGAVTSYGYDSGGNLTSLTDPDKNVTSYSYNADNLVTMTVDPLGHQTDNTYNAGNELTATTDRDGRTIDYGYDSGGRKTTETWVGGSYTATWTYDGANEITQVADPNSTLSYQYDSGGRLTSVSTAGSPVQPGVTLTYGYDTSNNLTSLSDNIGTGAQTAYAYDDAMRLTTLVQTIGGTAGPQVVLGYDPANRLTSETRTVGSGSTSIVTSLTYDSGGRVTEIVHQKVTSSSGGSGGGSGGTTTTPLATYIYAYDSADRLTTETNADGTFTYTYDRASELTAVGDGRTESYSYDSGGNRTMTGYATGTGNELTNSPGATYTYDNEGNTTQEVFTSGGTTYTETFTWDYRNRLAGFTETNDATHAVVAQGTYTYDSQDRRIGVQESSGGSTTTTWTVYNGLNPYADFNGSGQSQERYLYGPSVDEILARTNSGGTTAWYLTDKLGSVRDLVDSSGNELDHVVYDSFGNILSESNPSNGDRFKFDGMAWDVVLGLYYDNARYIDSATGRFTAQDPIGFRSGDNNFYMLVHNIPTIAIDLTGLIIRYPNPTSYDPGNDPKRPKDTNGAWLVRNRSRYFANLQMLRDQYKDTLEGYKSQIDAYKTYTLHLQLTMGPPFLQFDPRGLLLPQRDDYVKAIKEWEIKLSKIYQQIAQLSYFLEFVYPNDSVPPLPAPPPTMNPLSGALNPSPPPPDDGDGPKVPIPYWYPTVVLDPQRPGYTYRPGAPGQIFPPNYIVPRK